MKIWSKIIICHSPILTWGKHGQTTTMMSNKFDHYVRRSNIWPLDKECTTGFKLALFTISNTLHHGRMLILVTQNSEMQDCKIFATARNPEKSASQVMRSHTFLENLRAQIYINSKFRRNFYTTANWKKKTQTKKKCVLRTNMQIQYSWYYLKLRLSHACVTARR